jgi:hypothetical protein
VIHDAVLHLLNEQPLVVDVFETPLPSDAVLVCTNLRTMSRTRPIFADSSESTFVFSYAQIRFVELPNRSAGHAPESTETGLATLYAEPEPEIDEDFLRRVRDA